MSGLRGKVTRFLPRIGNTRRKREDGSTNHSMKREAIRARIEEIGIIPAIRLSSSEDALFAAEAVASAGIPIVEVTMTIPGAMKVIDELTRGNPEMIVGAGTLLDVETAQRCLDAGASFLTTTGLDLEIVEFARRKGVVVFPVF